MIKSSLHLVLAVAAFLPGAGLLSGCASQQPYAGDTTSEARYRLLYPRKYYNSLDARQQKELEEQALKEQVESDRK